MQGIEVLYWALSVVFCLALVFAILFWCRNWRNEEREGNLRQLQQLAREVRRLSEAVEGLENTSASLQTADEQLSLQVENIRNMGRDLKRKLTPPAISPVISTPPVSVSKPAAPVPVSTSSDEIVSLQESSEDRYAQARDLLLAGETQTDVARQLDLGTAEVRMIARLLEKTDDVS
ncbi:MAG: hypothetical protein HOE48_00310 [Candidatus Latescibacteria bacterium]|jgi:hypothetical protein|nr:hypothetical protein [Candidatus Latescibacterota bacterium]